MVSPLLFHGVLITEIGVEVESVSSSVEVKSSVQVYRFCGSLFIELPLASVLNSFDDPDLEIMRLFPI